MKLSLLWLQLKMAMEKEHSYLNLEDPEEEHRVSKQYRLVKEMDLFSGVLAGNR